MSEYGQRARIKVWDEFGTPIFDTKGKRLKDAKDTLDKEFVLKYKGDTKWPR